MFGRPSVSRSSEAILPSKDRDKTVFVDHGDHGGVALVINGGVTASKLNPPDGIKTLTTFENLAACVVTEYLRHATRRQRMSSTTKIQNQKWQHLSHEIGLL